MIGFWMIERHDHDGWSEFLAENLTFTTRWNEAFQFPTRRQAEDYLSFVQDDLEVFPGACKITLHWHK